MNEFTFVEHSHGEFEGSKYDNVVLSDGLLPFKVRNASKDGETLSALKEGDRVKCTFKIRGSKTIAPKIDLIAIEKAK